MRSVLVTGGAGFIGSNFVHYVLDRTDWRVVNLDLLTYAGNLENLISIEDNSRYQFIKGDISDSKLVGRLLADYEIDTIVNFAAESHVDRSIEDPHHFLQTNVCGTQSLLDQAILAWRVRPEDKYCCDYKSGVKFLQVSTDEVYGSLGEVGKFQETTPLSPNSPYSASKASADMFVRAYHHTYALPINITRCSNNYGPYQFPEKMIPLMINNALDEKTLPVYGDGLQIRDWLHVEDHCSAIVAVLDKGRDGEIYNIGGNNEKTNIDVVRSILKELGKSEGLIEHIIDRPGHDRRYAIDNAKIQTELGWAPRHDFENGLKETIQWYIENSEWIEHTTSGSYQGYYEEMYGNVR